MRKLPTVISFSGKAQSGKDTSAEICEQILEEKGYKCIKMAYANYLKFLAEKIYGWNGEKDEYGRSLLQNIGKEVRISDINFWVDNIINVADIMLNKYDYILISDCRYENEIQRWKDRGYEIITIKINRPNFDNGLTEEQKQHESETALDNYNFDYNISAENIEDLRFNIKNILEVKEIKD